MDLQTAEEQLPQSINPLSLQIMRLTGEYTGTGTRLAEELKFDLPSMDECSTVVLYYLKWTDGMDLCVGVSYSAIKRLNRSLHSASIDTLILVELTATTTAWLPAWNLSLV